MGTLIVYNNTSNLRGDVHDIPSYDKETNRLMLYGLSPMNPGESYVCKTALDVYGGVYTIFETNFPPSKIRGIDGTDVFSFKITNDYGDFVGSKVSVYSNGTIAKVEFFDN